MLRLTGVSPFTSHLPTRGAGLASSENNTPPAACQCPSAVTVPGTHRESAQVGKEVGAGQRRPRGLCSPSVMSASLPVLVRCFLVTCGGWGQTVPAGPIYCFAGTPWTEREAGSGGTPCCVLVTQTVLDLQEELMNRGLNE